MTSPYEPLRETETSSSTNLLQVPISPAEELLLEDDDLAEDEDLNGNDVNGNEDEEEEEEKEEEAHGNAGNDGEEEEEQVPSPTVSIHNLEIPAEAVVVHRPWWLWAFGILDIVIILTIMMWTKSFIGVEKSGQFFTMMTIAVAVAHLVQFTMGLMLLIGLCIPNDVLLILCLRVYLYGCYFLLLKTTYLVVTSIIITSKSEIYGHERWQRIVGNMFSLIVRFPAAMMVQEFLKRYNGAVTAQVSSVPGVRLRLQQLQQLQQLQPQIQMQQVRRPHVSFAREAVEEEPEVGN